MDKTLKMFRPFIDKELGEKSLGELAYLYQSSPTSNILATSFEKIFKLAVSVSGKYWGLDDEDVASWCLEKLDYCLKTYNGKASFQTYFSRVFSNKLREETEKLNYKKRKCILESLNEIIDIGLEDTYNLLDMLLPRDLTTNEKGYCMLASQGYDNTYIAEILDVSRMTVSNIRKSLRVKCSSLQI